MQNACSAGSDYSDLDQFIAAGCLNNAGACAFCAYAQTPASQPWPSGGASCRDSAGAAHACRTRLNPREDVDNAGETVCFSNPAPNYAQDRLCIFTSFETGRTNIERMDVGSREKNLEVLIAGARKDGHLQNGKTLCFHTTAAASVPWTHMHIFDQRVYPRGPDGDMCTAGQAYCTRYSETGGVRAAARDLAQKVAQGQLGCPLDRAI